MQSRCLCIDCFYEYTPEYQAFLASRNTLVGKRSKSGPPAAAAAAAAAVVAAAGVPYCEGESVRGGSSRGRMLGRLVPGAAVSSRAASPSVAQEQRDLQPQQQDLAILPVHGLGHASPPGEAAASSGADSGAAEIGFMQAAPARQRSLGAGAQAPSAACSKGLKSRMLWGRGLTKALGVVRFKQAGDHLHGLMQHQRAAAAEAGSEVEATAGSGAELIEERMGA